MSNSKLNSWQTQSSETVYENPWISVSHREVIAPTGNHGIYGLVHFKKIAVGVVPIDEQGNTWLVGQHRYTLNAYSWEIPEGGGNPNEDEINIAKRELREETGLIASKWTRLLEIHTSNSVTDERGVGFIAQGLSMGTSDPDETELLQLKKLPISQAINMVLDGEITDALAIACLLKVQLLLDRGELTT